MSAKIDTDKNIIESAKITACKIADKESRKRAYALNLAANVAAKYFEADTKQSLYKVPSFSSDFEIADIYLNGVRYDVRVTFDGKTFCIPKVHQKFDAVPAAYIVVKLDSALKSVEILGFVPSGDLDYDKTASEYFRYEIDILRPQEEFLEFAGKQSVKIHPYSTLDHDRIKELCTGFIDGQITETEKIYFIKHVIACPVCRETFCDMNDFDTILSQLKNYEELLNDSTLTVFSGNKEEFDQALIAGLSVVENESDGILESDIPMLNLLDFSDTEEIVEEETNEKTHVEESVEAANEAEEAVEIEEAGIEETADIEEIQDLENPESLEESGLLEELETLETLDEKAVEEPILEETADEEALFGEPTIEESPDEEPSIEELTDEETINEQPIIGESVNEDPVGEEPVTESVEQNEEVMDEVIEAAEAEAIKETEEIEEIGEIEEEPVDLDIIEASVDALEDIHPVEEEVVIGDVETLELGDLDTLDSLDSLGSLEEIDTPVESPEEPEQESNTVEEAVEVSASEEAPFYQEPVELKFEEEEKEEEENIEEEEVAEELVNDTVEDDAVEEANEEPIQNDEIQNLLDDDLLALLSDEEPTSVDTDEKPAQKEYVPQIEESVFAAEREETPKVSESDDTIHTLFENQNEDGSQADGENGFELAPEPVSASMINKTKQIATAAVLVVLLAGAGAGVWLFNQQKAAVEDTPLDTANSDRLFDFQNQGAKTENTQDTQSAAVSQDINRSMANSFSDKPSAISITKISWQVSEKLASEASVKEYLQTAGKNIQMNLQNDLANVSDVAFNNSVKVAIEIAPDNTIKGAQVLTSSGSDKIDDIILRGIKNTLKYVNVPKLKDFKSDYFLTLIINF